MVSPTNRELRSALRQVDRRRVLKNIAVLRKLSKVQLCRIRDAAKMMEDYGIEMEITLASERINSEIRSSK